MCVALSQRSISDSDHATAATCMRTPVDDAWGSHDRQPKLRLHAPKRKNFRPFIFALEESCGSAISKQSSGIPFQK